MSWFKNIFKKREKIFRQRFRKIESRFFDKISRAVVGKSKVDDEVLDELEEVLLLLT